MKRILTIAICIFAFSYSSSAQIKVGPMASLYFDGASLGVGVKVNNEFTELIEGQGSFTYFFETGSFWALDFDALYKGFNIGDVEAFEIVPFAGLNYRNFSVLGVGTSDIGINIGVSGRKSIGDSLDLFLEPKIILGGGSNFAITGGVFF